MIFINPAFNSLPTSTNVLFSFPYVFLDL